MRSAPHKNRYNRNSCNNNKFYFCIVVKYWNPQVYIENRMGGQWRIPINWDWNLFGTTAIVATIINNFCIVVKYWTPKRYKENRICDQGRIPISWIGTNWSSTSLQFIIYCNSKWEGDANFSWCCKTASNWNVMCYSKI